MDNFNLKLNLKQLHPSTIYKIKISSIILIICLIIYLIFLLISNLINSSKIEVLLAPASSDLFIDGNKVSNITNIQPGDHTIIASKDGFMTQELNVTTIKGKTTKIGIALQSNDPSTANWYQDNLEDATIADGVGSLNYISSSEKAFEEYPILNKLPYSTYKYTISQGICTDGETMCISISTSPGEYTTALKRFSQQLDDEPGKYHFRFINYSNPFEGEG